MVVVSLLVCAPVVLAQDIVKIAPAHVKVLLDNSEVRVFEYHAKKGDKVAMHSHPPNVVYGLSTGSIEFTLADGSRKRLDLHKGEAVWSNGGAHSQMQITDADALVIELKTAKPVAAPAPAKPKK
jgi:quercetin dioxygenase-like cupin family protein